MGPAPAIRKTLERAKLSLSDIDLFEVNEAFAGQYLSVEKELGLDREKVLELLTRERTAKRMLVEKRRAVLESDLTAEDLETLLQEIRKRKKG